MLHAGWAPVPRSRLPSCLFGLAAPLESRQRAGGRKLAVRRCPRGGTDWCDRGAFPGGWNGARHERYCVCSSAGPGGRVDLRAEFNASVWSPEVLAISGFFVALWLISAWLFWKGALEQTSAGAT